MWDYVYYCHGEKRTRIGEIERTRERKKERKKRQKSCRPNNTNKSVVWVLQRENTNETEIKEEEVVVVEEEEWNIESQHKHTMGIYQMNVPSLVRRKRKIALVWVLNWVTAHNIRLQKKWKERVAKVHGQSEEAERKKNPSKHHHLPSQHSCIYGILCEC